jgi:uncharacterized protein (TIGR02996 family)
MPEATNANALYLALDEAPGDTFTTMALADWYEEHGNLDAAECLRWSIARKRWPFRYTKSGGLSVSSDAWHSGWLWWALDDRNYGRNWGHPPECRLPVALWTRLPHDFTYTPAVFKEYKTRREAYEALFAAWPAFKVEQPEG